MATNSVGPDLYGGFGGFSRARVLLLIGIVAVLGLVMGVAWTIARNDPASSDNDPTKATPYVAPAGDEELPPAGLRTVDPAHAVLPSVAPASASPASAVRTAPLSATGLAQPTAPATPSAPSTTVPPTVAPATTQLAPPPVATAPPTSVAATASTAAQVSSATSPPVPAAVQTPATSPPASPSVVAPASEPSAPTGDRGDDGAGRDNSGRDSSGPSDADRGRDDGPGSDKEQRKEIRDVAKELLAKAKAVLDDKDKGKGKDR